MKRMLSFQVYGRGGRNLNSEWESDIVSYKGSRFQAIQTILKLTVPTLVQAIVHNYVIWR